MTSGGLTTVSGTGVSRRLGVNRLRERRPLDAAAVDRFLGRHEVPIVEGARCTFFYRGEVDAVLLVHRTVGLPERLAPRRLRDTDCGSSWSSCRRAHASSTSSRSPAATTGSG